MSYITSSVGNANINLDTSPNVTLGPVSNVRITGGTSGQVLTTDGSGTLSWGVGGGGSYGNSNVANYLPTYTGAIGTSGMSNVAIGNGAGAAANAVVLSVYNGLTSNGNPGFYTNAIRLSAGNTTGEKLALMYNSNISDSGYGAVEYGLLAGIGNLNTGAGSSAIVETQSYGQVAMSVASGPTTYRIDLTASNGANITAPLTLDPGSQLSSYGNIRMLDGANGKNHIESANLSLSPAILGTATSETQVYIGNLAGGSTPASGSDDYSIGIGYRAGNATSTGTIAIGKNAGQYYQGIDAITIGTLAGQNQGDNAVAVGRNAGSVQGNSGVAIGYFAASDSQGDYAVAIGQEAGNVSQSSDAVAIGYQSGNNAQGSAAVAVGRLSGGQNQGSFTVAVGALAGGTDQGGYSVAVGTLAGSTTQGGFSVAIGGSAAENNQGGSSIAIGSSAAQYNQGANAVAIGVLAGTSFQGFNAVAIGSGAGTTDQGANSVVIGANAGTSPGGTQGAAENTIIINATGTELPQLSSNTFTVKPIRGNVGQTSDGVLNYDTTTGEIFYGPSAAGFNPVTYGGNIGTDGSTGMSNVAIGMNAGLSQTNGGVAIGPNAAQSPQGTGAVAIGANAAANGQAGGAIAIGSNAALYGAGSTNPQSSGSIAIGQAAGYVQTGGGAIAIGASSGSSQQARSIAIGAATALTQQSDTISIGTLAVGNGMAAATQYTNAIAIGTYAAFSGQGANSVAIGTGAGWGFGSQPGNSIVINATGTGLQAPAEESFTVKPIRDDQQGQTSGGVLNYDTATGEIFYSTSGGFNPVTYNGKIGTASGSGAQELAWGANAASTYQGFGAIALGQQSGYNQSDDTIAIGRSSGQNQSDGAIAIGYNAGFGSGGTQGGNAIAIGRSAGAVINQGVNSIAIGLSSDANANAIGIGKSTYASGEKSIAIGFEAASTGGRTQSDNAIAIGTEVARQGQGISAIAIGTNASDSGNASVGQGDYAIAIGHQAGTYGANGPQGSDSIAIGRNAGVGLNSTSGQSALPNTITLNATGADLATTVANSFYVKPIRDVTGNSSFTVQLWYNPTTGEIGYK